MRYSVTFEMPRVTVTVDRDADAGAEEAAWGIVRNHTLDALCKGRKLRATVARQVEVDPATVVIPEPTPDPDLDGEPVEGEIVEATA